MPDTTRITPTDRPSTTETERTRRVPGQPDSAQAARTQNSGNGQSFADLLRVRQGVAPGSPIAPDGSGPNAVKFSAHAQTRLQSRQIAFDDSHRERLQQAVGRAAGKGSRDALVLMDDMALVVSVTNRTVVTVVDKDNLKQNVFTNIDSAVIA